MILCSLPMFLGWVIKEFYKNFLFWEFQFKIFLEWKGMLAKYSIIKDKKWQDHIEYAAAAAVTSVVSYSVWPHRRQPPGSPIPGILQARTLEWVAISFSNAWQWKVKVKLLSRIRLPATPWTAAYQAPPSMGFSRQEYWSGMPLPSPAWMRKIS